MTKDWLTPDIVSSEDADLVLDYLDRGGAIDVHGMARIAWDDRHVYANGDSMKVTPETCDLIRIICDQRHVRGPLNDSRSETEVMKWLLQRGTFDLTAIW